MKTHILPDVTSHSTPQIPLSLKWVGMENIAIPITLSLDDGNLLTSPAKADVFVNLDSPNAKGIHMSRLYALINRLSEKVCDQTNVKCLLDEMIHSQSGIGCEARVKLTFDLLLKKDALLSEESGYQTYPVSISAEKREAGFSCDIEMTIPYSSTCPCSASLARQLTANEIDRAFPGSQIDKAALMEWVQSEEGSVATPHSQRSYAYIRLSLGDNSWPDFKAVILQLEQVITTPVQTAVKRIDEQEFARLNAENLMFCEDAARRIKSELEHLDFVNDYWFKVEHQESLHAHNAVVIDYKKKP